MADKVGDKAVIELSINGGLYDAVVEPRALLSDVLRHQTGMLSVHVGCEHGVCGTCTVLLDGEPVRSCLMLAVQAEEHEILTVEGIGQRDQLDPVQQAFWEKHGLQCGFCTPAMVLTAKALLDRNPNPSEEEIRDGLSGNLCRCTGYQFIVEAVQRAAELRSQHPSG